MPEPHHSRDFGGPVPGALSIREAGVALGLSTDTIRRRIRDGSIAAFKVGPSTRIPTSEISRIRAGEQVPA